MFTGSLDYTICSIDPDNYNKIRCNLIAPSTAYASYVVTSLTAKPDIVILDRSDYLTIEDTNGMSITIKITKEYRAMQADSVPSLLIQYFKEEKIFESIDMDETGRLVFKSATSFKITDMSYNVSLILGFYNTVFPIESVLDEEDGLQCIRANSVGFTMSTPILYLTSNVGMQSYQLAKSSTYSRNSKSEMRGSKIVMRINNTYVTEAPIMVNNADFVTTVLSNDLSMLEFTLVDANMHDIKLLSPMYITIHMDAVKDEEMVSYLMFEAPIMEAIQAMAKTKNNED